MSIISDEIDERYPLLEPEATVTMARTQATMLSRTAYDACARRKPSAKELAALRALLTARLKPCGMTIWTVAHGIERGHRHAQAQNGHTVCLDRLAAEIADTLRETAIRDDKP